MENVLTRHARCASHNAKINYICSCITENPEFTRANNERRVFEFTAMRPKLQPQNAPWQISSINRVVIHALAQKPLVDTLRDDNCVLSVPYALRWIDVCECVAGHAVGGHISCFDFAGALNYSYPPHRFIFDDRITTLHIVIAPQRIVFDMTDTCHSAPASHYTRANEKQNTKLKRRMLHTDSIV